MRNRKHDIERYLRGELSPAEMHALEKEALSDPFLAEALEGVEQAGADNFLYDLHKIRRSVRESARSRSRKDTKTIRMWGWTSAIAASVLLVAVSGFMVISLLKEQAAREQAMRDELEALPEASAEKDTLTIIFPAEAPVRQQRRVEKPSALDLSRAPALIAEDVDAEQTRTEGDVTVAEKADIAEEAQARTNQEIAVSSAEEARDQESIAAESRVEDQPVSGALEGKTAGVQAKRSAVSRPADSDSGTLRGRVISTDGEALPGVNVMIRGTSIGTVTDVNGDYELRLPEDNRNVVFAFIGFETQEISVGQEAELNVSMKPDATSLSEVVVTGYGVARDSDRNSAFRFAEPTGGRSDFREYLAGAVRYPQEALRTKTEGKVTVRFTVEPDGKLTEFEVLKGIGAGCEEELIRAIKSGPAWKPSSRGDVPLPDKVKVRYRFVLPD